jgi:hypothetical protein
MKYSKFRLPRNQFLPFFLSSYNVRFQKTRDQRLILLFVDYYVRIQEHSITETLLHEIELYQHLAAMQ